MSGEGSGWGSRSWSSLGVKGGGGAKVGVKVRGGSREGVMVGGIGDGVRGQSSLVGEV